MSDYAYEKHYRRVNNFNGEREKWHEWANHALASMCSSGLGEIMDGNEAKPTFSEDIPTWEAKNSELYNRIVGSLTGPAAALVSHDGPRDGAALWQRLVEQYDGAKASRRPLLRRRLYDLLLRKDESAEDLCARLDSYAAEAVRAGVSVDDYEKRSIFLDAI